MELYGKMFFKYGNCMTKSFGQPGFILCYLFQCEAPPPETCEAMGPGTGGIVKRPHGTEGVYEVPGGRVQCRESQVQTSLRGAVEMQAK